LSSAHSKYWGEERQFAVSRAVGFNLHGKTAGLIGTGRIGMAVAKILGPGFGCKLLGYDPEPNPACRDLGLSYVDLKELIKKSDIVSLHAPLLPATAHLINEQTIAAILWCRSALLRLLVQPPGRWKTPT
jgi:D-lactate dehydrogenase